MHDRMRLELLAPSSSPRAPGGLASSNDDALGPARRGASAGATDRSDAGRAARDVVRAFLDGAPIPPPVRESHAPFVVRDLALALVELLRRPRGKALVRYYDEPWEMCIERFGGTGCVSVYRAGPEPIVIVYDRTVAIDGLVAAARDAVEALLERTPAGAGARIELGFAAAELAGLPSAGDDRACPPEPLPVTVELERDAPLSFGAEFALRSSPITADGSPDVVERSDMHALLFRGRVRAEIRGRAIELGECHPALVAERLVALARRAFDAWERGLALNARGEAGGVVLGMRLSPDGDLALTLGPSEPASNASLYTFPALGVVDVLEAALAFGRALVRAVLRRDRSQSGNLRLGALRRSLRDGTESLRRASQTDCKVNPTPEPYRAFAAAALAGSRAGAGEQPGALEPATSRPSRLRYAPRWRAIIPGIDLRATYLCGERVIVGAASEMWALDRQTGHVLWRSDVARGTSVVTPVGVARLAPDGALAIYDFATGERSLKTRIAPRVGGPVAGAVVHLPGLPRLVIVTEGEHHLVAIDLATGEPRWRWSWSSATTRGATRGAPRLKRSGRLVYVTSGDGALTALDVMTGAVVWRLRDRLRFRTSPTVAHDALYVVSGGAHGVARLYCIDAYAGRVRWATPLAAPSSPCTIEGAPLVAAGAVAVAVRQKTGLALAAFRLEDGAPAGPRDRGGALERRRGGGAPVASTSLGTSWLAVDDAFIGNAPNGEVVAIDAPTGELRWRHVLGPRPLEADVPRRLEPVLRCGALFVPCSLVGTAFGASRGATATTGARPHAGASRPPGVRSGSEPAGSVEEGAAAGVCILRPSDGALLGSIAPTEAIPDLLRVDERCDVYVAEESGHLASFGALPRLSLV